MLKIEELYENTKEKLTDDKNESAKDKKGKNGQKLSRAEGESSTKDKIKELEEKLHELVKARETADDKAVIDSEIENIEKEIEYEKERQRILKEREISANFGRYIHYLRKRKKLSLKELSEKSHISASYINRLEKGDRKRPSYAIMEKLAMALDTNIKDLIEIARGNKQHENEIETKVSLQGLIMTHEFKIDQVDATAKHKQVLIELFDAILNLEFTSTSFLQDQNKIMELVFKLRDELK